MAKFLLVDDNEELLEVQSAYLSANDQTVITARNGKEALIQLESGNFDIMVTDVIMPEMEGFETIMTVRSNYPDLPIVAVSGGGRVGATDYLAMAKSMGAKVTLSKPIAPATLLREARILLGESADENGDS
ncbi:response regulator [bacterium]|nr:response regulator [bacterium]